MSTLERIAELSGVSKSTVSRVINGDSAVRGNTRDRVLSVIDEVGYRPNFAARGLKSGRTGIIAGILPAATANLGEDPFFSSLVPALSRAADSRDHFLLLSLAEDSFQHNAVELAAQGMVDGVLYSAASVGDPMLSKLADSGTEVVAIGRSDDPRVSYVDVDNARASYLATMHLISLGRRRIGYVAGPSSAPVALDRKRGFLNALLAAGIEADRDLIFEGDFTEDGGVKAADHLLPFEPDAIAAASDLMALGVLRKLRARGVEVPSDVAVVGFDDIDRSADFDPPLTTIRQDPRAQADAAMDLLVDRIENPGQEQTSVVLPTELIVRNSCGAQLVRSQVSTKQERGIS